MLLPSVPAGQEVPGIGLHAPVMLFRASTPGLGGHDPVPGRQGREDDLAL
ncbi:hypothetical protein GCM10027061_01560 [Nesterenkonia suensis]